MNGDLLARADRMRATRTPFVLATVVRAQRPTSAKAGDRAIIHADGHLDGFVGGACAESTVRAQALTLLTTGATTLLRITPDPQPATSEEGLTVVANTCQSGGTLDIFLEPSLPPTLIQIYGQAPIAQALATIATAAGYDVRLAPGADTPPPPDTAAVIVAAHGRGETRALADAAHAGVPYIGLVASPRRGTAVLADLDLPEPLKKLIKTPAGLDLGAHTPAEVAITILAELIAVRARPRTPTTPGPRPLLPLLTTPATPAAPHTPTHQEPCCP